MPQNPFYIEPASGLPGFKALQEGVSSRIEYERGKAEEGKKQKIRQEAIEAEKANDFDKLTELTIANPWLTEEIKESIGFKNKLTEQNALESAWRIIHGEDPTKVLTERGELVLNQGGDAEGTIALAEQAQQDPEAAKRTARATIAYLDPAASKELRALEGEEDKGKIGSVSPDKYTPESINEFQKTGDYSVLKARDGEGVLKTYSVKNPDGSTRTVKNVKPGSDQEKQLLENGFSEGTQTVGVKPSAKERAQERINKATDKLTIMANEDPNGFASKAGRNGYRQNKDGSLFIDPVTGGPQELAHFSKVLGKRGNLKAMISLGEQWDDAKELTELLDLSTVQKNLNKAEDDGIWSAIDGKWNNAIGKWLQDKGISKNSNTATAIARIQRMASDERKKFMGTAVTDSELRSALSWMPSAGDSFETMINKTNLMGREAEQEFRRWISLAEDSANMAPFYKAFGIERFTTEEPPLQTTNSKGWVLHTDANDNKAYVSPDGTEFEEVQ